jgi:uncharacterized protein
MGTKTTKSYHVTLAFLYRHPWLFVKLPIAMATGFGAALVWHGLYPLPPTRIAISTAAADGAYFLHAKRYAERFAASGIALEIRTSAGSQENLARLRSNGGAVDLAFVQGGFGYLGASPDRNSTSNIQTLVNVDLEPLWIFSLNNEIESLDRLKGLRVAIGPE